MKNDIKLSIPNPCSENWEAMKPNSCGRFCGSCEKTVIDFTKMDDAAFVAYFQDNKKMSCGRFTERQLSLNIPFKSKPFFPFGKMSKYVAAGMIAVAGMSGKMFGQKVNTVQAINISPESKFKKEKSNSDKYIAIGGTVFDESNEIIIGGLVSLQNSEIKTTTDIDGKFYLLIPQSLFKNGTIYLQVSSLGYAMLLVPVNKDDAETSISLELKLDYAVLGGFDIVTKPTRWQRFKWWFKNNFL